MRPSFSPTLILIFLRKTFNDLNVKTWKKTFLKMSLWVIWTSLSACVYELWKLHLLWLVENATTKKKHSLLSCKNNSKRKSTLRQESIKCILDWRQQEVACSKVIASYLTIKDRNATTNISTNCAFAHKNQEFIVALVFFFKLLDFYVLDIVNGKAF